MHSPVKAQNNFWPHLILQHYIDIHMACMRLMYVSDAKQVLVSAGKLPALAFPANEQVNQCSSTTHQPLRKKLDFVRNTRLCIRIPKFLSVNFTCSLV